MGSYTLQQEICPDRSNYDAKYSSLSLGYCSTWQTHGIDQLNWICQKTSVSMSEHKRYILHIVIHPYGIVSLFYTGAASTKSSQSETEFLTYVNTHCVNKDKVNETQTKNDQLCATD